MGRHSNDEATNRLYQLPPNDFTRERNTLAKEIGGDEGKALRALAKPSASAWAVNQLYWRDRETYDALLSASERLRAAHRSILGGRQADLTGADAAHRDAVKTALASTLRLAKEVGQAISPTVHTEIAQTLESLTREDAPGRLTKPLRPRGFEALSGMPLRAPMEKPRPEPGKAAKSDKAAQGRQRKEAQRTLEAARKHERRDRAAVARLQKQVAEAERGTAEAGRTLERAQSAEAELRHELQKAKETLERSAKELEESKPAT